MLYISRNFLADARIYDCISFIVAYIISFFYTSSKNYLLLSFLSFLFVSLSFLHYEKTCVTYQTGKKIYIYI